MTGSDILSEQRRYYAARAPEYDDWWFRRGRYALDPETEAGWWADVAEVEEALKDFAPRGTVLELAAGTGIWTRKLVRLAGRVVALDANAETLARNTPDAEHVLADVFDWDPAERFDLCFFSFWLSHVPESRFDEFWSLVRRALRPGGRVFLLEGAIGDRAPDGEEELRSLADGREFRIIKQYWAAAALEERIGRLGFQVSLHETGNGQFLYGGGS